MKNNKKRNYFYCADYSDGNCGESKQFYTLKEANKWIKKEVERVLDHKKDYKGETVDFMIIKYSICEDDLNDHVELGDFLVAVDYKQELKTCYYRRIVL